MSGQDEQPDWQPRASAIGLPDGHQRHGSTGQLWEVRSGQWVRVPHNAAPNPAPVTGAGDYAELEEKLRDPLERVSDASLIEFLLALALKGANAIADLRRRLDAAEHNSRLWWNEHQRADKAEAALREARETAAKAADYEQERWAFLAEQARTNGTENADDEAEQRLQVSRVAADIARAIRALPDQPKGA